MVEDSGWISEVIPGDNSTFYFDADNFTGHWVPPENHNHSQVFLNSSEIRSCIITCTEAFNKGKGSQIDVSFFDWTRLLANERERTHFESP